MMYPKHKFIPKEFEFPSYGAFVGIIKSLLYFYETGPVFI